MGWIIFTSIIVIFVFGCKVQRTPIYIKEIQNLTDQISLCYLFNNFIEREFIKTFDIVSTPEKAKLSVWGALQDYKKIPLTLDEYRQTQHYILSLSLIIHVQYNSITEKFKFTESTHYATKEDVSEATLQIFLLKRLTEQLQIKLQKIINYAKLQ